MKYFLPLLLVILLLVSCTKTNPFAPGAEASSETGGSEESKEPVTEDSSEGSDSSEETESSAAPSGFDVSSPLSNWIQWDADGDGEAEELCFDPVPLGDEAPSYIEITMYKGNDQFSGIMDNAYGLIEVLPMEDEEGPYLQIRYFMGDYYDHDHEASCKIRYQDGALKTIKPEDEQ